MRIRAALNGRFQGPCVCHRNPALSYVARWTGSDWAVVGPGFDQPVSALVVCNNKLVAGGNFRTFDAQQNRHVAQWDGSQWQSIGAVLSNTVLELAVHQGSTVLMSRYLQTASSDCAKS